MLIYNTRFGDSLDGSFSKWEPLLQMIIECHPIFLTALTDEMVNELCITRSPHQEEEEEEEDNDNSFREAIYMWLDHILNSSTWETSRRLLSPAYVLAACDRAPNRWTKLLRVDTLKHSDDKLLGNILNSRIPVQGDGVIDGAKPRFADRVSEESSELADCGWQVSDNWGFRPLGIV